MTTTADHKNSVHVADGSANTTAVDQMNDDIITIRIPRKVTLELPRSFQLEIPRWVGYTLMASGVLALLHYLTGGAVWHFWWLIFIFQPWNWGSDNRCHRSENKQGWDKTDRYSYQSSDDKDKKQSAETKSTDAMYV